MKRNNRLSEQTKRALVIALIVYLCIAIVALAIAVAVVAKHGSGTDDDNYKNLLEAGYHRAYYDLQAAVGEIELKLNKLQVATSAELQESILYEIWKSAEIAEISLAGLGSLDEQTVSTAKFINQSGDYAYYLSVKIGGGTVLTAEQKQTIAKIKAMYTTLSQELAKIGSSLQDGRLFLDTESITADVFDALSQESVEYPQMIYDGPFSDALLEKSVVGLSGEILNEVQGNAAVEDLFVGAIIEDLHFDGKWSTDIVTLNYTLKVNGTEAAVQLAERGGKPVQLTIYEEVGTRVKTDDECITTAKDFAEDAGFGELTAVWVSDYDGTVYVNLAPKQDETILYPDLVKVKINGETGKVIGFDSRNYCFNHTERTLKEGVLTEEQAKDKLSEDLETVGVGRLALIPLDDGSECLTYEFAATLGGEYLIYLDAYTGAERNVLYVIDSADGSLLI